MPTAVPRLVLRLLALGLPVAAGVLLAAWLVGERGGPEQPGHAEQPVPVVVIAAPEIAYVPRAVGYGEARPARIWRAVPEVGGEIVATHPELESGALIRAGAEIFRIDPTGPELAIREAEAVIAAGEAALSELGLRRESTGRLLEIERQRLAVAQSELERQRTLLARGTISQSALDRQEREFLQQRLAAQELENALARLPAEERRLEAERERERARLARARRDLANTVITAPFDLRVAGTPEKSGQVVQAGETLMQGDGIGATEVEAEVPIGAFRALIDPARRPDFAAVERVSEAVAGLGLRAEVRLRGAGAAASWSARVDRVSEAIDPRTRTVGVVVVVDRPYETARPPERPPLVKGMYAEVRLCGPARPPAVVVPHAALHEGRVYLAGTDDRLKVRVVTVASRQGGVAVLADGVAPGERVVLTDIVPAVEGMRLAPRADAAAAEALAREARAEGVCR
ncbi:MAG TPA: HlyD family efflux transporter periplasmic adaptor subunit [Thermohalobaculum sp.]|nr:HlyD family efflux transporter periplasmic adaptor subunit [Thermohalobaculum sp.]